MVHLFRTSLGAMALAAAAFDSGETAQAANGPFLAHQALYDLSLVKSRGKLSTDTGTASAIPAAHRNWLAERPAIAMSRL